MPSSSSLFRRFVAAAAIVALAGTAAQAGPRGKKPQAPVHLKDWADTINPKIEWDQLPAPPAPLVPPEYNNPNSPLFKREPQELRYDLRDPREMRKAAAPQAKVAGLA